MNWYAKGVLTVIAGALLFISFRLAVDAAQQRPNQVSNSAPTIGDLRRLGEIGDPNERARERRELFDSIPLVRVQGGSLEVEVKP